MTREEAKEILTHNWTRVDNPNYSESELDEAFFMAIEALSAEQVTSKLKNPCDSLLTEDNDDSKEQKSKLESADDTFCKSQLITCNRVKECNGVCPFEDALKHADQEQSLNEQNNEHDREWIIGCIKHDGFIKTDRFDKANQIILDALADRPTIVRCKDCYWYDKGKNDCDSWEWCKRHKFDSYDDGFCSWAKMKGGAE